MRGDRLKPGGVLAGTIFLSYFNIGIVRRNFNSALPDLPVILA